MTQAAVVIKVPAHLAHQAREIIASRVRLRHEESGWFFSKSFTIIGAQDVVEAAKDEIDALLDAEWLNDQW